MDPCDPKTNASVARAAVIEKLLVPGKMIAHMKQSELCDLLITCTNKQLPDPPLMTKPKKFGKYMISVYIKSPLKAREIAILLGKPSLTQLKAIASKLGVFTNSDNLKDKILTKLASDGIPEPIRFVAKGAAVAPRVFGVNVNREKVEENNRGVPNRENNRGVPNREKVKSNTGRFNLNTKRHHIVINQAQSRNAPQVAGAVAIANRRNKRVFVKPQNFNQRPEPSYEIASQQQQILMRRQKEAHNAARFGVPYGGEYTRERMNLEKQRQQLALEIRKAQQNKELMARRMEFNARMKKLSEMEKQLANKAKAPTNMNKLKKNLENAQKVIAELKQKPQNASTQAKIANTQAKVLVMNSQVAATHVNVVPKAVEAAKQVKNLPEPEQQKVVENVVKNLAPVAVTNSQKAFVNKVEKLVENKQPAEAARVVEKEANLEFNTEKAKRVVGKAWNVTKGAAGAVASGAKAVAGAASNLYKKATRPLTVEEKRAILNKLLQNSSVSNVNKVKIRAIHNLVNFPKMTSVKNVTEYYNKLIKNKNYSEIAQRAEQYGGIRGSLLNLRKMAVNKKNDRLVELINRFQGSNGGAKRISNTTNSNMYDRLQEVRAELQSQGNKKMNKEDLKEILNTFNIPNAKIEEILEGIPSSNVTGVAADNAIAIVAAEAAQPKNSRQGLQNP
jgi:hypothetical protein